MQKSLFIKALAYAGDHPDGFTLDDLKNHLGTDHWGPLRDEFTGQRPKDNLFFQSGDINGKERYWLTGKGHRLLFEIKEIQDVADDARRTRIIALISIITSMIVPICIQLIWPGK